MAKKVVTRFAPSPTGYLHVGGLRTALYNYLFAKKNNGTFYLRIEDTDQERKVEGADKQLISILSDFGMVFEGEPVYQSQHKEEGMYQKYAEQLVAEGKAYYCFCSKEDLDEIRERQKGDKVPPGYWGAYRKCAHLSHEEQNKKVEAGESHIIRFKMQDAQNHFLYSDTLSEWTDKIHETITVDVAHQDDFVIIKGDGFPTYNFANVIDDYQMGVTHVIRGEEFIPSTAKHLAVYDALGWERPQFAHLPLLLNKDKSKLSKRQNDVAVEDYLEKGYLKEALLNFVALLGWNPGEGSEEEIFSLPELEQLFSLEKVNKSGAIFDIEN